MLQTKKRFDFKNGQLFLLGILVCLLAIVNLSLINNDSVWCDEAYTMIQCRQSFQALLADARVDAWPPFYAIFSWIVAHMFGATVPVLKFFSFFPSLLIMILGMTYIKKEFNSFILSGIFIFLVGVMPISLHMNIEIRGYSWGMFFSILCGILSYHYFFHDRSKRTFMSMVIAGILGAYTHYFALITVALVFLSLFIMLVKENKRNIIICIIITVICFVSYLPWLNNFFRAAKSVTSGYWIQPIRFSKFAQYFLYPFTNIFDNFGNVEEATFSFLYAVLMVYIVIQLVIVVVRQGLKASRMEIVAFICLAIWAGNITLGYLVSKFISPMYVARYMYFAVGFLWLFLAIGVVCCIRSTGCLLLVMALFLTTAGYGYGSQRNAEYENGTEEAKAAISKYYQPHMGIFSDSDYLNWTEIKYYFPESVNSEKGGKINVITDGGKRDEFLFLCTDKFAKYKTSFTNMGYEIKYIGEYDFDGCYYFKLYRIKLDFSKKSNYGKIRLTKTIDRNIRIVQRSSARLSLDGIVLNGYYTGSVDKGLINGEGSFEPSQNKLDIRKIEGKFVDGELHGEISIRYNDGRVQNVKINNGYFSGESIVTNTDDSYCVINYGKNGPQGKLLFYNENGEITGQDWYFNAERITELIEDAKENDIVQYYQRPSAFANKVVKISGTVKEIFQESTECVIKLIDNKGNIYYLKYPCGKYSPENPTIVPTVQVGDSITAYGLFLGIMQSDYELDKDNYGYSYPAISIFYVEIAGDDFDAFSYSGLPYEYKDICENPYYYAEMELELNAIITNIIVDYSNSYVYYQVSTGENEIYYVRMSLYKFWRSKMPVQGDTIKVNATIIGNYRKVERRQTDMTVNIYPLVQANELL